MPPHKDSSSLPVIDRLKLIDDKLEKIEWNIFSIKTHLSSQDDQLKLLRIEVKEINKRFDKQDKKFDQWKSQLFTKIDKSFAKPVRDLRQEQAAQEIRLTRLETKNPLN